MLTHDPREARPPEEIDYTPRDIPVVPALQEVIKPKLVQCRAFIWVGGTQFNCDLKHGPGEAEPLLHRERGLVKVPGKHSDKRYTLEWQDQEVLRIRNK